MLFLFYIVVTGTATSIAQLLDPDSTAPIRVGVPPGTPMGEEEPGAPLRTADIRSMATTVVRAALASATDTEAASIRLQLRTIAGQPRGIVTIGESDAAFDARTGAPAPVPPAAPARVPPPLPPPGEERVLSLAEFIQELHSGHYYGRVGEWAMLITGFAIVILTITGLWMYWSLWMRRHRNGRRELFW